jgi:hypothetical protein
VAVGLSVLALAGFLTLADERRGTAVATASPADVAISAPLSSTSPTATPPAVAPRRVAPGVPVRLRIPALRVDAPIDPVTAPNGVLRPPDDPNRLGWWSDGARTGSRHGTSLLAGHSVNNGDGALDHLADLRGGDVVEVDLPATTDVPARTLTYRVESVTSYDREELARDAADLFRTDGKPALAIVTCIDFNGVSYQGNLVVRARPASS